MFGRKYRKPTDIKIYPVWVALLIIGASLMIGGILISFIGSVTSTTMIKDSCLRMGYELIRLSLIPFLIVLIYWAIKTVKEPKKKKILANKYLNAWLFGNHLYTDSDEDSQHIYYPACDYINNKFYIQILPGLQVKLDRASKEVENYFNSLGYQKLVIGHYVKNGWMVYCLIDDFSKQQLRGIDLISSTSDYIIKLTKNIKLNIAKNPNILITGPRNSGKSWLVFCLIIQMACKGCQLFLIDPKNSDLSKLSRLMPQNRVATSKQEIFSLLEHFVELMKRRRNWFNNHANFGVTAEQLGMYPLILVFEEYGAFSAQLSNIEKKKLDALLAQISLLGRQYLCMCVYVMQQVRASTGSQFPSSLKEQTGTIISMGELSEQSEKYTFGQEYDIPQLRLYQGEGFIWYENNPNGDVIEPFIAPDLSNLNVWRIFQNCLKSQTNDPSKLFECHNVPASQYPD
ncbi:FtsK/SpoIIIE domain-containing protein [uncultured Lactobacillus sp.]|mgnify:CR=1 FL=1|jgi:energy-coupling factor transporter ATP-binding protein EcfA2|uniref:FtsK/SpoIIIE domain-containing protein n=1 Tax=uncultured Lactobacillus sp. TaxID=153152 RepID=UPI002803FA6B|nr:FtsK/SpoIIIE domain-containing protein [uncultured Lactobacillus sp.]